MAANVTYLGNPHPIWKKRIQLKSYYPAYFQNNSRNSIRTVFLGVYSYGGVRLFVLFDPETYFAKKSHNSSAHVYAFDLAYAQRIGHYEKRDAFNNHISILRTDNFKQRIEDLLTGEFNRVYDSVSDFIIPYLTDKVFDDMPTEWNGIDCYKEMLAANDNNARQGQWAGFYFEFLTKNKLKVLGSDTIVKWHSDKSESGIDFDLFFPSEKSLYGDLKADKAGEGVLGNSLESFDKVMQDNGKVLYICIQYIAEMDKNHDYETTKFWNALRDNPYTDLEEIKTGYGRKMIHSLKLTELRIISIDKMSLDILKEHPFKQGHNSDGKARKPKIKLTKEDVEQLTIYLKKIK